jgi:hypothetical protein
MEILNKIKSVKLCLMAHPDYEIDSEFEDRVSDLEQIENELSKNKWIKVESDDDLPKEDCHCWILDKEKGLVTGMWKQAPNEMLHKQACFYWRKRATHYKIISKPDLPIN